jgi:hypothetical protein
MRARAAVKTAGWGLLIGASLFLVGCSESKETLAAKACIAEMARKVQQEDGDRPYSADIPAIAAVAKTDAEGIIDIESEATLDAGQAKETKQKFTCRVQFDQSKPDAEPEVILFQFTF